DGIRDLIVTGVQTCALPICRTHLSGNLLVQHARNDELHYFELARRQQIKNTPSPIFLSAMPPLHGGSNQCVVDALKQIVSAKRQIGRASCRERGESREMEEE